MSVEQAVVRTDRDPEGAHAMQTEEGYGDWVKVNETQFELFRRVWSSLPGCQMALNVKVNSLLGRRIDVSGPGWMPEQLERARLRYRKMVEEYMRDTACYGLFICTVDERTRLPHRVDPASVRIWTRRTSHDVGEYVIIRPETGPASRRVRMTGVAVFERCKPLGNGSLDSPLRPLLPEIRLANAARVCSLIAMRQNAYPLMFTTVKQPDDPGSHLQRAQDTGEFLDHARASMTQHELDAQQKARDYNDALERSVAMVRYARLSADPTNLGMGALLDEATDTLTFDLLGTERPNLYPLALGATPVAATTAQEPASLVVTNARIDALTCRIMGVSPAVLGGGENKQSGAEGSVTGMVIGYTEMAAAERHQLTSLFNILAPVTADGVDIGVLCNNGDVQDGPADDNDDSRTVDSYEDAALGWNLPDSLLKQFAEMSGERDPKRLFRRDGRRTLVRRGAGMGIDWNRPHTKARTSAWAASGDVRRKRKRPPRKPTDSQDSASSSGDESTGDESSARSSGPTSSSSSDDSESASGDDSESSSDDESTGDESSAQSRSSSASSSSSAPGDDNGTEGKKKKTKEKKRARGPAEEKEKGEGKDEKTEKPVQKKKKDESDDEEEDRKTGKSAPKKEKDGSTDEGKETQKPAPKRKKKKTKSRAKGESANGGKDKSAQDGERKDAPRKRKGKAASGEENPDTESKAPSKANDAETKKAGKKKKRARTARDASAPAAKKRAGADRAEKPREGEEDLEQERKRLQIQREERVKETVAMRRAMMKLQAEEDDAREKRTERTRRRQLQTVSGRLRERARQTGTTVRLPSHLRTLAQGGKRGPLETRLGPQVEVNACIGYLQAGLISVKQATDVLVDVHGFVEDEMPKELLDPITQRPLVERADMELQSGLQLPGGVPASGDDRVAPRGLQAPGLREKKPGAASAAHRGIQSK